MTTLAALLPDTRRPDARQTLELSFTAVTPVYLHGADPTKVSQQEASVRGALHRWLWILLGGLARSDGKRLSAKDVAGEEARVFGTTAWSPNLGIQMCDVHESSFVIAHNPVHFAYVGWPLANKGSWPAGTTFKVRFDAGPVVAGMDTPAEALALAASCWCWATLGWLGGRGRRGFGALRLTQVEGPLAGAYAAWCGHNDVNAFWIPPILAGSWSTFLTNGLNGALRAVAALVEGSTVNKVDDTALAGDPRTADPPKWSSLAPGYWRLLLIEYGAVNPKEPAWANALAALSRRLRAFRQPRQDLTVLENTTDLPQIVVGLNTAGGTRREIDLLDDEFGLPRPYVTIQGSRVTPGDGVNRRPSPVIARPVAVDEQGAQIAVVWLSLRSVFLPGSIPVTLRSKPLDNREAKVTVTRPTTGLTRVRDFMVWLKAEAGKTTHADLSS